MWTVGSVDGCLATSVHNLTMEVANIRSSVATHAVQTPRLEIHRATQIPNVAMEVARRHYRRNVGQPRRNTSPRTLPTKPLPLSWRLPTIPLSLSLTYRKLPGWEHVGRRKSPMFPWRLLPDVATVVRLGNLRAHHHERC